tara:strand:- start:69 stop:530 length:462 start_codon:yes stop_codon:yes gene_type:complete
MAIYFPPLFCGIGSKLKSRKNITFELGNKEYLELQINDICVVKEIIGYGFNITKIDSSTIFRVMNSSMDLHFEILENVNPNFKLENKQSKQIQLKKDFLIESQLKIKAGTYLIHIIDNSNKEKIYHNLYSLDNQKVLRLKDSEFESYFKKANA